MRRDKTTWSIDEWIEYYDGLAKKNYMSYQETGEPRCDKAQYKYEKIADAFRAYQREKSEKDVDIKKRMANCDGTISKLIPSKTYSFDEVSRLLRGAVWW